MRSQAVWYHNLTYQNIWEYQQQAGHDTELKRWGDKPRSSQQRKHIAGCCCCTNHCETNIDILPHCALTHHTIPSLYPLCTTIPLHAKTVDKPQLLWRDQYVDNTANNGIVCLPPHQRRQRHKTERYSHPTEEKCALYYIRNPMQRPNPFRDE